MQKLPSVRRGLVGLIAVGVLAVAAGPAQAASGPGPFYAEPAWDQKFPADTRFLVLTNWNSEAVLDKETGLVWERSPATTQHTWSAARSQCTSRTTGNRKGWRLPSVHELASLVHPSVLPPALPLQPGHPFLTVQEDIYWSATTSAPEPASAWFVFFFEGTVGVTSKGTNRLAWCVRGGHNDGSEY